jgi:hypothetical protein
VSASSGSSGSAASSTPSSSGATGSASTAGTTGTTTAKTSSSCLTSNLGFTDGPDNGPQSAGDTSAARVVKLTNKGSASCTLYGFPGVDLKTNYGTMSVPRSKKSSQRVTLAPGGTALINIVYPVNNGGGSGVKVESMVITPPGETHSHTMAWEAGSLPVTDGSGASMLGVDPVVAFAG